MDHFLRRGLQGLAVHTDGDGDFSTLIRADGMQPQVRSGGTILRAGSFGVCLKQRGIYFKVLLQLVTTMELRFTEGKRGNVISIAWPRASYVLHADPSIVSALAQRQGRYYCTTPFHR